MLNIYVPNNYHNARSWIIRVLFDQFFEYELFFADVDFYIFENTSNSKTIKVPDFFIPALYIEPCLKLHLIRLFNPPNFVKDFDCLLLLPKDQVLSSVPIETTDSCLLINYDFIGFIFWSLSNWEEYHYQGTLDSYGRFSSSHSSVGIGDALDIPWVDYWAIFIRDKVITVLGCNQIYYPSYRLNMTHDIDSPWKYGTDLFTLFKNTLLPIKQNLDFKKSCSFLCNAIRFHLGLIPDPHYTFEWIFKIAQQHKSSNTFYIISGASSKYDPGYSLFTKRFSSLLGSILINGHKVGLHPSFMSSIYPSILMRETSTLNIALQPYLVKVTDNRQHFLKYSPHTTPSFLSDLGFLTDSSIAFPDKPGFRLGTCHPFNMFDIKTDQELPIRQIPLIVMDVTLSGYLQLDHANFNSLIHFFKSRCQEVSGLFTVLWHNNQLLDDSRYRDTYRSLYN